MKFKKYDIKKSLKLNYNIMIIVIHLVVFIQVFSIPIFPIPLAAAEVYSGDDGDNELYGSDVDDEMNGGPGNDYLYGNEGADLISGGDGDDRIIANVLRTAPDYSKDYIRCGNGEDRAYINPSEDGDEAEFDCEYVNDKMITGPEAFHP